MRNFSAALAIFMLVTFAMPSYANTSYESETSETSKPGKTKKSRKSKVAKETREVREMREARRTNDSADTVVGYARANSEINDESADSGSKIFLHHMFTEHLGIDLAHAKYGEYTKPYYFNYSGGSVLVFTYDLDLRANNIAAIVSTSTNDAVSFYGKFGVSVWSADVASHPTGGDTKGNDPLLGLGMRVNAGGLAMLKLEYESVQFDDGDANSLSIGIGIRF